MQELKETVLAMINNGGTEEDLEAVVSHIDNTFLEKDKEQIIKAHLAGQNSNEEVEGETEIEYYNQTYNK